MNKTKTDPHALLIMSAIGLACSISFFLSIPGLVISSIAKSRSFYFMNSRGALEGEAKRAKSVARLGIIIGILLGFLFVFYMIGLLTK